MSFTACALDHDGACDSKLGRWTKSQAGLVSCLMVPLHVPAAGDGGYAAVVGSAQTWTYCLF